MKQLCVVSAGQRRGGEGMRGEMTRYEEKGRRKIKKRREKRKNIK